MRFIPALLLSLALCLPTTAYPKGGHGGSSHASRSHVTYSQFDHGGDTNLPSAAVEVAQFLTQSSGDGANEPIS